MHPLKTTTFALAGLAVLLMIGVQFLPWLTVKSSSETPGFEGFGFSVPPQSSKTTMQANTWDLDRTVTSGDNSNTADEGWSHEDFDDADGIGLIRASGPTLLVGLVATLAGGLLAWFRPNIGGLVTLAGGVVLTVATILFSIGLNQFFDDVDYTWALSFYFAIAACACAITAGVLTFAAQRTASGAHA